MKKTQDFQWSQGLPASNLVDQLGNVGFQSVQLNRASEAIKRMYLNDATIYLTYTSNMVTSGLRGFFAQLIKLGLVDQIVTTVGGIEEDIMKANGEDFLIGTFNQDDTELYEKGINRVGNIKVHNESYAKFEDTMQPILRGLHDKQSRWTPSEIFHEIGGQLDDENSILNQAHQHDVPIYCPAITDGSFGFHLFLYQQKHDDFIVDVVRDFKNIVTNTSHDERKGVISLGGSISKHHALLACLLNGGLDYAVYMTTASTTSGSMSGATTDEAKSWGKIKDESDAATVHGDVTITFPLAMSKVLDDLQEAGMLQNT